MENKEKKGIFERVYDWFNGLTLKGVLGAVLTAFVILIILICLSFLPTIFSRFSSSLSAALYSVFVPAESSSVTVDKKIINSGEDFTITFKKGDSTDSGLFAVSHACGDNADLFAVLSNGLKKIDCDTPYYLLENDSAVKIRATTQDSVVRLAVDASFENNDTQKVDKIGVARVTIKNDSVGLVTTSTPPAATSTGTNAAVNTNVTPANQTYYTAPVVQPIYIGKPDLAVRMLQVGLLNSGTNVISSRTQFSYNDMVGIKFEVRNDGDANTGPWTFTATLPSVSTPTYNSNSQISLKPGESIIFTLGFSNLVSQYTDTITVNVDPLNLVTESNENNNTLTSVITNINYNNNNTNSGYYDSYGNWINNNNNNYNYNTTGCYIGGTYVANCNNSNYNNNNSGYYDSYGNWISNNNYNNNNSGYYDSYGNWISSNNNNYNNNNNYSTLGVTCYATQNAGRTITWYASAFGGSGNYTYSWGGDENLYGSYQNVSKTYSYMGTKDAIVTVSSNGYYVSHTCTTYVY